VPLIDLWKSNAKAVDEMAIEQIAAIAGDGNLKDDSKCSSELREFFSKIASQKIGQYVDQCLENSFNKSGLIFQDLINELGRRLDYQVENGRYQGTVRTIGFDGIWRSSDEGTLVVEVKTTDAYRISLETVANYRKKLSDAHHIPSDSTVLIVVGRQDTGELEAQVRGSRYAWDIRIISADALVKLVQLKENSEGGDTAQKIRQLLTPLEYTRLDRLVDVMFTTATEVENAITSDSEVAETTNETPAADSEGKVRGVWQFTDSNLLQKKREEIVSSLNTKLSTSFIKKTKATLWDTDHKTRIAVTISKRYTQRLSYPYWYAYHPQWDDFLSKGERSFIALGCMDLDKAFLIPHEILSNNLHLLNTTTTADGRTYWHLHVVEESPGRYALLLPKADKNLDITTYICPIS